MLSMGKRIKTILACTAAAAVAMTAPAAASTGTVTADILNVRDTPSTDGAIESQIYMGDDVTITYDTGNGWYEIYKDGGCHYVNGEFISTDGSSSSSASCEESYEDASYDDASYEEESYEDTNNYTYLGNFTLTAYCGCAICCGSAGNPTASGVYPTAGHTVAMGGVDFGTQLLINGTVYTVEDRGTGYGHVDIYFSNHADAVAFGMQSADVYQVN